MAARPGLTIPGSPRSALESIQSVRAAQAPHWTSLQQEGQCGVDRVGGLYLGLLYSGCDSEPLLGPVPIPSPSNHSPEGKPSTLLPGGSEFKTAAAQAAAALSSLLDQLCLQPTPPVRTAVALTSLGAGLVLPPDVLCEKGSAPQEETQAWARWAEWAGEWDGAVSTMHPCVTHLWSVSPRGHVSLWFACHRLHEALAKDEALTALGKVLYLLDGILDGQVGAPGRGWGGCGAGGRAQGPGPAQDRWPVQGNAESTEPVDMSVALCPRPFPQQPQGQGHEHPIRPVN